MALIDAPIAGPAEAEDRNPALDEIIDLTDRRRVLLRLVLGLDAEPGFADAVFTPRATDGHQTEDVVVHIDLRDPAPVA
jgi:hypothetical protein